MKKFEAITLLLSAAILISCNSKNTGLTPIEENSWTSPVTGKTYQLIFNDEFSDDNIDTCLWTYRGRGWTNTKTRTIKYNGQDIDIIATPEAVELDNGIMKLNVFRKKNAPSEIYTGGLATIDKFRPQYGYYETRVNFSECKNAWGYWPAFWIMYTFDWEDPVYSEYNMQEDATEIDIFEYIPLQDKMHYTLHWWIRDTSAQPVDTKGIHERIHTQWDFPKSDEWHVAGLEWTPEELIFYWNGEVKLRRPAKEHPRHVPNAFEYVCFSMSAGTWGGNVADPANKLPARCAFDYCRVYQQPEQKAYYKMPEYGNDWVLLTARDRLK